MIPIVFIYPHDDIFRDVKQESSYLAERKTDENGNPLFEQIVFDEEYLTLFRILFSDARADVTSALSAYTKDVPQGPERFEIRDFTDDGNYEIGLAMPDDFTVSLTKPVEAKIRQYIIAYILFRWLETKLPLEAEIYFRRLGKTLSDIKEMLNRRSGPIRIADGYWEI
jgi:hypothetical protein